MTWEHWWFLTKETLRPETGTWVMMFLPIVIGLIMIACYRGKTPPFKGAWSELGRRWTVVGLVMAITAILVYFSTVYYYQQHPVDYTGNLEKNSKELFENRQINEQIQFLASFCDEKRLNKLLENILEDASKDKRQKIVNAAIRTPLTKTITYEYPFRDQFHDSLYWPEERKEQERKLKGNIPAAAENMPLSLEQIELYKNGKMEKLHESLSEGQWKYLIDQFVRPMNKQEMIGLIECLIEDLGKDDTLIGDLREGNKKSKEDFLKHGLLFLLNEMNPSLKCAFLAGVPQEFEIFDFFISYYNWLRELPYLLIYLIAGIVMLVSGGLMIRQGKKPLLNI